MESFTRHQLDAILTATDDEECPACGGWGLRNRRNPVTGEPERLCLVCNGTKRVPGKPLIIGAAVEAGIDVVDALVKLGVLHGYEADAPAESPEEESASVWTEMNEAINEEHDRYLAVMGLCEELYEAGRLLFTDIRPPTQDARSRSDLMKDALAHYDQMRGEEA